MSAVPSKGQKLVVKQVWPFSLVGIAQVFSACDLFGVYTLLQVCRCEFTYM